MTNSRRRHVRNALIGLAALVVGGPLVSAPVAHSAPAPPPPVIEPARPIPLPPELDPGFYRPDPAVVAATAPGRIIAAREVRLANVSLFPLNVDAWQVSYRSTDTRGEAIPAVATVMKPRGSIDGPRRLLSLQMAEDSLAQYCAPSYVLQHASVPSPVAGQMTVPLEFVNAIAALQQGWAVVIPDYQGNRSAYAAGPLGGRITLDGIRAAENFAPLGLDGTTTRVGMLGYSGGAIATGHAAELHASYAPELDIVGVAEGGIPADLGALVNLANNNLAAGLVMAGVIGVSRESTDLAEFLDRNLDPVGKALVAAKNPLCVGYQTALLPFANLKGMFVGPGDPLQDPVVTRVLGEMKMGRATPRAPMFMYQANPDWIVPVGPVNTLVDTYCKDPSARVEYTRDHFSEHLSLEAIAAPSAMLWLRDRFDGVPVEPGCRISDTDSMALAPETVPMWTSIVGETVAALFGKAVGAP